MKLCPECGQHRLQKGTFYDEPNEAEGETGIINQPILYCCGCTYQENDLSSH